MARVNVGVNPKYLADQHLIAESVEITMITGGLRKNGYVIKSLVPPKFKLGTGHINFFKNKIRYLNARLLEVNAEMVNRGIKPGTYLTLSEYPDELVNNWNPDNDASDIIRNRIVERLKSPLNGKKGGDYYRYRSKLIGEDMDKFCNTLLRSELYSV